MHTVDLFFSFQFEDNGQGHWNDRDERGDHDHPNDLDDLDGDGEAAAVAATTTTIMGATVRRPQSIHQYCAKGSPTDTLKALWCMRIFLLFPLKTRFLVYTKPLFCLLWHLNFRS